MFHLILYILLVSTIVQSVEMNLEKLSNCSGEFSGYNYRITSPNYPKDYPENIDCIYILKGSHLADCDQIFHLQFLDFSLKPSEECKEDFLEIGDKSVFCGNVGGIRRYPGKDNKLRIRFHTSKINGIGRGFNISVTTLPCSTLDPYNSTLKELSEKNENKNEDNAIPQVEPLSVLPESSTESLRIHYNNLYPIYSPPAAFTIEEDIETTRGRLAIQNTKNPAYNTKSFNGNLSGKLEPMTNNKESESNNSPSPPKISAYFFVPPETQTFQRSTDILSEQSLPSNYKILPFRSVPNKQVISLENQLSRLETTKSLAQKIGTPESSYGVPDTIPYPWIHEIKTGEVFENTRGIDCSGTPASYPAATYGQPGPSFSYLPQIPLSPPTQYLPSGSRPNNFVPTLNPENYFPTVIANSGQCCKSLYSSQRFLLSSPGFPSLIYSSNPYECIYAVAPYSPNICRLRLNFKFFNFGTEDQLCSNGYLEIDGRRYCGCKTGLNVVSNIPNLLSKIIDIRYTGFPRTNINGFLIEVIQERCIQNGYPYLSRSKKDVGNERLIGMNGLEAKPFRIRRNVGYSYSKPSIPFNSGEEHLVRNIEMGHLALLPATKCQAFSLIDWTLAAKETYLRNARCISGGGSQEGFIPNSPSYPGNGNVLPNYPPNNNPGNISPGYPNTGQSVPYPPSSEDCETVAVTEGIISSPFYPSPYPNNNNKCWRFYRAPVTCRLQLSFLDFDVESSPGCVKDYIAISNQHARYCGGALTGSKTLLGFPSNNFIDIHFISDNFGTGRGFTIAFSQIPCQVEVNR